MAAFSHNGEPGSALDAELKGRDTRHMDGYKAGFKAGREAGMREASEIASKEFLLMERTGKAHPEDSDGRDRCFARAVTAEHIRAAILAEIK